MQTGNTAITTVQLWTLIIAAVAALGLGAIVGAVITALATSRRERGAWIREKQMDANLEYYAAVEALHHLVLASPDTIAMQAREDALVLKSELERTAPAQQVVNVADQGKKIAQTYAQVLKSLTDLQQLIRELRSKYQRLMTVGELRTVGAARLISEALPSLCSQAIVLPGATGSAASQQRVAAEKSIHELAEHLLLVIRRDMGLMPWRELRRRFDLYKNRKLTTSREQAKSPVDRQGAASDLVELLRKWEVLSVAKGNDVVPKTIDGYALAQGATQFAVALLDPADLTAAEGPTLTIFGSTFPPTALILIKPAFEQWRLGFPRDLPDNERRAKLKDAIRVITSHGTTFDPTLDLLRRDMDGCAIWML